MPPPNITGFLWFRAPQLLSTICYPPIIYWNPCDAGYITAHKLHATMPSAPLLSKLLHVGLYYPEVCSAEKNIYRCIWMEQEWHYHNFEIYIKLLCKKQVLHWSKSSDAQEIAIVQLCHRELYLIFNLK